MTITEIWKNQKKFIISGIVENRAGEKNTNVDQLSTESDQH